MKSQFIIILAFLAMILSFSNTLKAQKSDSPIFTESLEDLEAQDKVLPILNKASFVLQSKSAMKPVPPAFAKRYSLPKGARMASKALVLKTFVDKKETHCIQFSCASHCESCNLIWFDRNGDGKIQAVAELRCMDKEGKQSGITAIRVECK
ncbi:MAG: hypothetical protein AB8H47_18445 [Bacteroidia bacterium]